MPFHEYANYPGCSDAQWKSYAPEFPGTAPDFKMGGTGLSGLALIRQATRRLAPSRTRDVMLRRQPDHAQNPGDQDAPRRPALAAGEAAAISSLQRRMVPPRRHHIGPDGCLYIVDWYNKIISHNEVPRNHPERDKKRGRIWRVKHKDAEAVRRAGFHEAERRRTDREARRRLARAESSGVAGDCGSEATRRSSGKATSKLAIDRTEADAAAADPGALGLLREIGEVVTSRCSIRCWRSENRNIRREALRAAVVNTRRRSGMTAANAGRVLAGTIAMIPSDADAEVDARGDR